MLTAALVVGAAVGMAYYLILASLARIEALLMQERVDPKVLASLTARLDTASTALQAAIDAQSTKTDPISVGATD